MSPRTGFLPKQLGPKLSLFIFTLVLLLGAVTALALLIGFKRTQDSATSQSRAGLEDQGREMLLSFANMQAFIGQIQLTGAAEPGPDAARYYSTSAVTSGSDRIDLSGLRQSPRGQIYDATPGRVSDLIIPSGLPIDDETVRVIQRTAALDALFPAVLSPRTVTPDSANFDPIAIYFVDASGIMRSYPPMTDVERLPLNAPSYQLLDRLGPEKNPSRSTVWTPIYQDQAGRGLVVTAYTPVYVDNSIRGVIAIDLAVAKLVEQVDQVVPTPSGYAFYIDSQGRLLPSASAGVVQAAIDDKSNESFAKAIAAMRSGNRGVADVAFGGKRSFVAYVPFQTVGGSFALVSPVDELTAKASAVTASINHEGNVTIAGTLAAMAAIFAAALVLISLLNRHVILNPLHALMAGTEAVAAGDLTTALRVNSEDELGALATSFNRMTEELRQRRDELEEKEAQFRSVFESASDGMVVVDPVSGRIVECNAAFCAMHGYAVDEMIGKHPIEIIEPASYQLYERFVPDAVAGNPFQGRSTQLRKDGSTFVADVTGTSFDFRGSRHVFAILRDVTDAARAYGVLEERVEERTRELSTLLDVSRSVASTLEFAALTRVVLDQLCAVVDYERAVITIADGENNHRVVDERGENRGARTGDIVHYPPQMSKVLKRGEPIIVDDIRGESEFARLYQAGAGDKLLTRFGHIRSWMAVPIVSRSQLLGTLILSRPEPDKFDARQAALATAFANQVGIAMDNARLFEQAQQLAAIDERQRLARELHDSVSQALYGIALGARTARTLLDRSPEKAVEPVDYVLSLAEAGLAEMRALIFELRPESLESEGLVAALDKQVAVIRTRHATPVEADFCGEPAVSLALKADVYRIGQEALHNIVKHARAKHVRIALASIGEAGDQRLILRIDDDGVGFDPSGEFPGHLGLRSMRERVARRGGTFAVVSDPSRGTRLTAEFPIG